MSGNEIVKERGKTNWGTSHKCSTKRRECSKRPIGRRREEKTEAKTAAKEDLMEDAWLYEDRSADRSKPTFDKRRLAFILLLRREAKREAEMKEKEH